MMDKADGQKLQLLEGTWSGVDLEHFYLQNFDLKNFNLQNFHLKNFDRQEEI